jgi:hypothetical protein
MKLKLFALLLTLSLSMVGWAQDAPSTPAAPNSTPAPQAQGFCYHDTAMKDGKSCCHHGAADSKDAAACCGKDKCEAKDSKSCCEGKDMKSAMKDARTMAAAKMARVAAKLRATRLPRTAAEAANASAIRNPAGQLVEVGWVKGKKGPDGLRRPAFSACSVQNLLNQLTVMFTGWGVNLSI